MSATISAQHISTVLSHTALSAAVAFSMCSFLKLTTMKTLYTVSFFADMLALIKLSYVFISNIDSGHHFWLLLLLLMGMAGSIALLIFLLSAYINLPDTHRQQ